MRRVVFGTRRVIRACVFHLLARSRSRLTLVRILRRRSLRRPPKSNQQPIRVQRFAVVDRPVKLLREQLIDLLGACQTYEIA